MWRELADSTTVPLATGERLYARWQFQDLIATRGVHVLQPDLIQVRVRAFSHLLPPSQRRRYHAATFMYRDDT